MPSVTRVRIENITPAQLVQLALEGRIRVPTFQRGYRWSARDVENLFDSVIRRYPIGIILLWERPAPAERISIGSLVLDVPAADHARWVVDGQQRITSLVGGLAAPPSTTDPRFAVYVHLPTLEVRATVHPPSGPWLPLRSALSVEDRLRWLREHAEVLGPDDPATAEDVTIALREYPIPSYIVEIDDERDLYLIFERVNSAGRPLKRAEVFDALHGLREAEQPATLRTVADAVAATGFGRLDDEDVLSTLLALRGPDTRRDTRDEFKDDEDTLLAFGDTERVLLDVVTVAREDLFIPHVRVLPHPSVIPLLAALLHRFGRPSGRAATLLRRWVWRAAAMSIDPASDPAQLRRGLVAVTGASGAQAAVRALLEELPAAPRSWRPDLAQVGSSGARARINMLGLIALEPKELVPDGRELPLPNPAIAPGDLLDTVDRVLLAIVPRVSQDLITTDLTTTMANRILHPPLPGPVIQTLLAAERATRASHAVDDRCSELLAAGEFEAALQWRTELLRASISKTVDERAEWGARDRLTAAELLGPISA